MSSKRAKRRKLQRCMCGSKRGYESKEIAQKHTLAAYKAYGHWLRPYRCRFCKLWHIGHTNKFDKY